MLTFINFGVPVLERAPFEPVKSLFFVTALLFVYNGRLQQLIPDKKNTCFFVLYVEKTFLYLVISQNKCCYQNPQSVVDMII